MGPTIHTMNKRKMLNTLEKFCIYKYTIINNKINNKCKVKPNVLFDTLVQRVTVRSHSIPTQPVSFLHISVTINTHAITHASTNTALFCKTLSTHAHFEFLRL